jgi:predicted glycosyltransferase
MAPKAQRRGTARAGRAVDAADAKGPMSAQTRGEIRGLPRATSGRRVMLYSHDTFGLGHLRRSRAIAQALTAHDPELSALIVTGSPIAGRFDFPDRVDHVRLPGVVKQADGSYRSLSLGVDIEGVTRLRAALLAAAEDSFRPDLLIVDKEPWGFRNEMAQTLAAAKAHGARMVLGLRDVLDDAPSLLDEWTRKNALEAVERFYDEIWVYGAPHVHDPLEGLPLSTSARRRVVFTGYLRRESPPPTPDWRDRPEGDYVLVTTGGGGDGAELIDWTLAAYESARPPEVRAVLVYGPFLPADLRADFERRAQLLGDRVETVSFDSRIERLIEHAVGVVAMGGYNTFCEILSLDKPAVIAPRVSPRQEQLIRAMETERLGLVRMLHKPRDGDGPEVMADAIRRLPSQPRPSSVNIPGLLNGAETILERARLAFYPQPQAVAHGL